MSRLVDKSTSALTKGSRSSIASVRELAKRDGERARLACGFPRLSENMEGQKIPNARGQVRSQRADRLAHVQLHPEWACSTPVFEFMSLKFWVERILFLFWYEGRQK